MPRRGECRVIDGQIWFIDYSTPGIRKCAYCKRKHKFLCDWPIGEGKTCDKPLCPIHTNNPAPEFGKPELADIDYCPEHYREYLKKKEEVPYA